MLFLSGDAFLLTELGGLQPTSNGDPAGIGVWDKEFTKSARQANAIPRGFAKSATDFTGAQAAAITGVVQTIKALNFMYLAETRDTLGIPVYAIVTGSSSPPYCNQDVWRYIVALLDSANAALTTAGPIPLPVVLPAGFGAVGQTASPSTNAGSFAAFNRALAGKAGLELALAQSRETHSATHPTPSTPGQPDVGALTRADSAITASALYDLGAIAPPVAGNFALDAHGVYHGYSETNPAMYRARSPSSSSRLRRSTTSQPTSTPPMIFRWKNKFKPLIRLLCSFRSTTRSPRRFCTFRMPR